MSRPTMTNTLENGIQKSRTRPRRSVHHTGYFSRYPQSIQDVIQKRRVVVVRGGRDDADGDALTVDIIECMMPRFTRSTLGRLLAAAWSLRDAAIDGHLGQYATDDSIVLGIERHVLQSPDQRPASVHSSRRRRSVVAEHSSSAILQ
jgi:hypothetical protein